MGNKTTVHTAAHSEHYLLVYLYGVLSWELFQLNNKTAFINNISCYTSIDCEDGRKVWDWILLLEIQWQAVCTPVNLKIFPGFFGFSNLFSLCDRTSAFSKVLLLLNSLMPMSFLFLYYRPSFFTDASDYSFAWRQSTQNTSVCNFIARFNHLHIRRVWKSFRLYPFLFVLSMYSECGEWCISREI